MLTKEQLLSIRGLKLSGKINQMSDMQFSVYLQTVNKLIDNFPGQAEKMQDAADDGSFFELARILTDVCNVLEKLCADDLVRDCRKHLNTLRNTDQKNIDQDVVEAFVEQINQNVSALSIDIQMAAHKKPDASPRKSQPQPPMRTSSRSRASIFAVDNAIMFLNTLQKLLQDHPYELEVTTSCSEAIRYLQTNRPDVILLDIEMPEMDGYELATRIKRDGNRAPIIFITANSAREYVEKAVQVGAAGLLMKPLRINQLLDKLKDVL